MRKLLCLLTALLLTTGLLAGCQNDTQEQAGEQGETAAKEDTLVMAAGADLATMDPGYMSQSLEIWLGSSVYDALTWTPLGSAEPQMRVAESYTLSDDGLVYTFTLRDDVLFHNGEKLTVDDVLYSLEVFRTSAALVSYSYGIADVKAEGNDVSITLSAPDPAFWENMNWCFILPKAAHEAAGKNFGTEPVGSGPYQAVSYRAGDKLVLKAFPDYYRGKAAIENCEVKIITDPSTAVTALETGEVHYASVPFTQLPVLEDSDKVECRSVDTVGSIYVYGVVSNPPYDNPLVRKAIAYSIDRQLCSDVVFGGQGTLLPTPVASVAVGTPETVKGYSYDPEKAKELLAEAGYPGGEGLRPISIDTWTGNDDYAEILQSNLSAIGVEASVNIQEMNALLTNAATGSVDLCIMGAGCGGNISQWGALFVTGGQMNFAQYSSARVDELFAAAPAERDAGARQEMYEEALRIVVDEDAAYATIVNQALCHAYSKTLDMEAGLANMYVSPNPYDICFK